MQRPKDTSVKFALENVLPRVAADFLESVLNSTALKHFGFCYDLSRDQIDGPRSFDLFKRLSHRLIAGHLSDRIIESVEHVTIRKEFNDFDSMIDLLNPLNMKFPLFMRAR